MRQQRGHIVAPCVQFFRHLQLARFSCERPAIAAATHPACRMANSRPLSRCRPAAACCHANHIALHVNKWIQRLEPEAECQSLVAQEWQAHRSQGTGALAVLQSLLASLALVNLPGCSKLWQRIRSQVSDLVDAADACVTVPAPPLTTVVHTTTQHAL